VRAREGREDLAAATGKAQLAAVIRTVVMLNEVPALQGINVGRIQLAYDMGVIQ